MKGLYTATEGDDIVIDQGMVAVVFVTMMTYQL